MKRSIFPGIMVLLLVGAATAWAGQEQTPPTAASQSFSVDDCRTCHEQQVVNFEKTYHMKLANSCANCHGNVAEHLASGDPAVVTSMKSATAEKVNETCLGCHNKARQANWSGGMHERRGLACSTCHSVHSPQSLKAQLRTPRESETCFGCHPAIRAQTMRTSHHPIREGKVGCADCHDPHDGRSPKFISASSINEKCYSCHTEKRGPFLWEHAPVREDCMSCHTPHGSNHDKLLVSKRPFLCQRCHSNTRHPGTLYDLRNSVTGASPNSRFIERACQNCHTNIHGSNAPSGAYLGR